jgi:uncharacterized protein YndB with AHSA1/START domain
MNTGAWTHGAEFLIAGEPRRVFDALTDPAQLSRWFAEHAQVEAREGGSYRFWGRHTYGGPGSAGARQRITALERDRRLAFAWDFDGVPSEVTLELSPESDDGEAGPRTRLRLRHAFEAPLAAAYARELVEDLWKLSMGNLDAHLRGGEGIVLPDYTDPSPEIRLSIVIDAPRDRVFRALIDPELMNGWIASGAEVEPRVGGRYRYGWQYEIAGKPVEGGPTRILDLVENERLVTDWLDWRGDETRASTRIAWLLEDHGAATKVTLVHGEFSRAADFSDYPFGWGQFLSELKAKVEGKGDIA